MFGFVFLYVWIFFFTVYILIRMSVNKTDGNTVYIQARCPLYLVFSIYCIALMTYASLVLYKDHRVSLRCFFFFSSFAHAPRGYFWVHVCVLESNISTVYASL